MNTKTKKKNTYKTLNGVVNKLRDDLNNKDYVLIFAYNATGKTRLSMDFKDHSKKKNNGAADTLYFNAFTEDLFIWDNDLQGDEERYLKLNSESAFFAGFQELALEEKIFVFLERYADFDFKIDYQEWKISFKKNNQDNIKISRGEQNIFIWCIFLAICQLTIDGNENYSWVKQLYIDDPISSLDDNNAIAIAHDLANLIYKQDPETRERSVKIKAIISTHHSLFFNVISNELRGKSKKYFYAYNKTVNQYTLYSTSETPYFYHISLLKELQQAVATDKIYTYHFNMMRNIFEKTATFFGYGHFSDCIYGIDDEDLFTRALQLLSHGGYSIYEPKEMVTDTKDLFKRMFNAFIKRYQFNLDQIQEISEIKT